MEKLIQEFTLVGITRDNLKQMYEDGREIEAFHGSDEWLEFSCRLRDIQEHYRKVERWVNRANEKDYSGHVRIEVLCKQLESAEREILKYVPDSAKLIGLYGEVVRQPCDTKAKSIAWMFDYAAYLYGIAYAFDAMEGYLPMLSMLKSDIVSCQENEIRFHEKETLWSEISQLKATMKKFEKDFDEAAKMVKEKEARDNLPSVTDRLSLEEDH